MKAIVLSDNIAANGLSGEWGLSIYIEYGEKKILLDTGASGLFSKNAEKLGVRLKDVDYGVLSHAHYDHANGMKTFFAENSKASFYLREGCGEDCYFKKWVFHKYIGIQRGFMDTYKDRIRYADGTCEIAPGVTLLPHSTEGLEVFGQKNNLFIKERGRYVPDSFAHEQSLVFDTEKGLVIFSSCSHGGADNIIKEAAAAWPGKKICAMIGGFHLYHSTEEELRALAARIRATGIEKIYTGHCTGGPAYDILKEELGDQAEQLYTGMELIL